MIKTKKKPVGRHIRCMSYQERLRNYEREKESLFYRIADLPASEVAKAHAELVRKWGV